MKSRLKEILIAHNCLVLHQKTTIAYDPTLPNISAVECVLDLCNTPTLPPCMNQAPPCADMFGCGYDGAGQTGNVCWT